jgi:phage gp16-like protein
MILPLDNFMESKRKCKRDNEAKTSCKVMALDEKIKILDKLRCGMSAVAVGLTCR